MAPAEAVVFGIQPVAPIGLRVRLHGPARALDVRIQRPAPSRARGAHRARQSAHASRAAPARRARRAPVGDRARRAGPRLLGRLRPRRRGVRARACRGLGGRPRRRRCRWRSCASNGYAVPPTCGSTSRGEVDVERLSAQLAGARPRPIELQGVLRWDRRALRFDASRLVVDGNDAMGEVVLTHDAVTRQPLVTIRARRLSLSPALVEEARCIGVRRGRGPATPRCEWTPNGARARVCAPDRLRPGVGRGAAATRPRRARAAPHRRRARWEPPARRGARKGRRGRRFARRAPAPARARLRALAAAEAGAPAAHPGRRSRAAARARASPASPPPVRAR